MPDDSGDFRSAGPFAALCETAVLMTLGSTQRGAPFRSRWARLAVLYRGVLEVDVKLTRDPEDLVEKLDTLVGPAAEPETRC